jgi:hypothetical protein
MVESVQVLCKIGATIRRQPITDFAAAVLAEQLECLRRTTADLDRRHASNVKRRRMKFKDQVAYLALRERIASARLKQAQRPRNLLGRPMHLLAISRRFTQSSSKRSSMHRP